MFTKSIRVRDLEISPPLALAPMVGLSHSALRSLTMELGGVGLFFTEMLSAKRLPRENEKESPLLIRTIDEKPLFYQIYLSDIKPIKPAVAKLHQFRADGIDINFGCPAPNLRKQGAGCALTHNHSLVRDIVKTFRKSTDLPLSAKIRIGEKLDSNKFVELCKIIEGEGVDLLTVHARLNGEKFCRKPKWEIISHAKDVLKIPIIANGGIFKVEDAKKCLEKSKADGLMIGRGAAENPLIFREVANAIYEYNGSQNTSFEKPSSIYFRFVELLIERFNEKRRLGRLKQFSHYFAKNFTFGHRFASLIQNSGSIEQAVERAEKFFSTSH